MREIEVKVFEYDKESVLSKIEKLGAKKAFDNNMRIVIFKSNSKEKEVIRLREEGDKTIFTHKHSYKFNEVKSATEDEVEVSNFNKMKDILVNIGFKIKREAIKKRTSYLVDFEDNKIRIEFDKYLDKFNYIPEFMEIEAETKEIILKFTKYLGINNNKLSTDSLSDLIETYR